MIQRNLFDAPSEPPCQAHSRTSRAAALAIAGKAGTRRRTLYEWMLKRGEAGATDEEAQDELGWGGSGQRPRRIELQQMGLVIDSGRTRKTTADLAAVVWLAVPTEAEEETPC